MTTNPDRIDNVARSLRSRLREETRELHEAVERELGLGNPSLSLKHYQDVLARFYGFQQPWEARLELCGDPEIALEAQHRRRAEFLRQDLRFFNIDAYTLPLCTDLPEMRSRAQALGGMYVMEGSTLGGQFIIREVERSLGVTSEAGGRYFYGYGAQTGSKWRSFEHLLHGETDPASADTTVNSARQTFEALRNWFRRGA